jgi:cadmium resistance protein CadD (predicted permease)
MKLIDRIGFFRLTLIPLGIFILVSAYRNGIWGMGLIGLIVLTFGLLNKCLLFGQCDVEDKPKSAKRSKIDQVK